MRLHVAHMEAKWSSLVRISSILAFSSKMVFSSATVTCQGISQEIHWKMRQGACFMQTDVRAMSSQSFQFF